jgi:drug/metabolite transporter (DMT)-like permease
MFKKYLELHFIILLWGVTGVIGKLITIEAIPLVWGRMFVAVVITFVYLKFKGLSLRISKQLLLKLFLVGVLIGLHWLAFYHAIKVSNVSITLVMLSSGAFFTAIFEPIFYKRPVSIRELIFGLLILITLYFIFRVSELNILGMIYGLIAAILSAAFAVFNGLLIREVDAKTMTFYEMLFGLLLVTAFMLNTSFSFSKFLYLQASDYYWLLLLGSLLTVYPMVASAELMKYLSPYTMMLSINLEPVYGVAIAYFVFQSSEKMDFSFYLGALTILLLIILNTALEHRKQKNN